MTEVGPLRIPRHDDVPERPYRIAVATMAWDDIPARFFWDWSCLWCDIVETGREWADWWMQITSGSLLPIARNRSVFQFRKMNNDYTHLLMIDSDVIGLTLEHIRRMVLHDVPIVAPVVCLRGKDMRPACESDDGYAAVYAELKKNEPGLVPRRWVGTGCVLIQWPIMDPMAIQCEERDGSPSVSWFRTGQDERTSWKRDWQEHVESCVARVPEALDAPEGQVAGKLAELFTEAWMMGHDLFNGGRQVGEDVEFGLRAGAKGFQSYIDCGIQLGHLGERTVKVKDHLDFLAQSQQAG